MALFEDDEVVPPPPPPPPVKVLIEPPEFKSVTIDTKYTPSSSLLTWVEGSNWTADYYQQILDSSSEPTPQALDRDAKYQQYRLIKKLDLKVTNALSFSQDTTVRTMAVNGSGITYPFIVPNVGDMFVANIGDGRIGVFTITQATRATILKDSVYNVDWTMVSELNAERMKDFELKTIETYYYSKSSLANGCGPFLTTPEYKRNKSYAEIYGEICKRYITDFYSNEKSVFLVPDQVQTAYDHFLTKAFMTMVDSWELQHLRKVRLLNVTAATVMSQPTMWDAILRQDPSRLYGSTQKTHLVSTRSFRGQPTLQAMGYTGIARVVYPMDAPTDVDAQYSHDAEREVIGLPFREGRPRRPLPGPHKTQAERDLPFFRAIPEELTAEFSPWEIPPTIHPVVCDEFYVFSQAFYFDDVANQSKLEMLALQLIKGESLDYNQFDAVLASIYDWDNLERFYYHPIVIALLKYAMR